MSFSFRTLLPTQRENPTGAPVECSALWIRFFVVPAQRIAVAQVFYSPSERIEKEVENRRGKVRIRFTFFLIYFSKKHKSFLSKSKSSNQHYARFQGEQFKR